MKQSQKLLKVIILFLIVVTVFTATIYANSAEPPYLTIIVSFPADDLSLSIRFADGNETDAVLLKKEQKAWETYYRCFYWMDNVSKESFDDAVLIVNSSEKSFECTLPASTFKMYNNLLTLDLNDEELVIGQLPFRAPLLITMRVVLTLLIEGLIFFIFGYRKKISWIVFLCVNLVTQGALNISLSCNFLNSYWIFGYVFYEIIIFLAEAIAFASILKEKKKSVSVLYALIANLLSLVLGGLIIGYLPI